MQCKGHKKNLPGQWT